MPRRTFGAPVQSSAPQGASQQGGGSSARGFANPWPSWQSQHDNRDRWQRERDEQDQRDREDRIDRDRREMLDDAREASRYSVTDNRLSGTGSLISASKGQLIVNANGQTWHLAPAQYVKVEILGDAGPDVLKPGIFVKLRGDFDSQGNNRMEALRTINALDIITPEGGASTATMVPALTSKDAADATDPNDPPLPKTARTMIVTGKILKYLKGELTLDVTGTTVRANLDPATAITLRSTDITLARPGDRVDVTGYVLKPGYAVAESVTIHLANAIGNPLREFARQKPAAKTATNPGNLAATNAAEK
jgi:hypothetical protein